MVSLCLGVFDVIEVATIAIKFDCALVKSRACFEPAPKGPPKGIKKDALLWATYFFLIFAIIPQPPTFHPYPTSDFITFGFGVNSHCQRKGFSQLFTPRFCIDYFWNAQQLTAAVNFDFSIFRVLQRSLPAKS